ncbi:MAG: cation:proton antiporter [Bacteroidetes bacterium]|nr:cation:proton antiporter [Bacteroidota bacterium]
MENILNKLIDLRDVLTESSLFTVGILLIFGYVIGRLVVKIKLPEITGYIIAGLLLGDTVTGIVHHEMGESLKFVTDLALGLIALTIGGEFYSAKLKSMGKAIVIMTITQVGLTFAAVSAAMGLLGMELPFALLLGAIATATAPAATVAIVQALRVHGKFVDHLYGLVALDDAGAVVVFGVVFALAVGMLNPVSAGAGYLILHAVQEIVFSLLIGAAAGYVIHLMTRNKKSQNEILLIALGIIFIETALAKVFELSPLMSNMAAGALLINASPRNHRLFKIIEPLTPPIYALFFVIAGTELNPGILIQKEILIVGFGFVIVRAFAKYFGVRMGAVLSKSDPPIRKYLGFCMVPQAGVAIGLVLMIQASPMIADLSHLYGDRIVMMVNIVLLSVFVNELIGPSLSKFAIVRAMKD